MKMTLAAASPLPARGYEICRTAEAPHPQPLPTAKRGEGSAQRLWLAVTINK
jgi:hypothetical protein